MQTDLFDPIPHLRGETMTKAALASLTGETMAELDRWVRDGCPCKRTGEVRSPLEFDSAQTLAWRTIKEVARQRGEQAARIVRVEFERDALLAELERVKR